MVKVVTCRLHASQYCTCSIVDAFIILGAVNTLEASTIMSSEEKIEASSKPEEQQASEEQPTAVEKEPTATKDEQPKPDPSSEAEKQRGEESEPAAAAEQEATEEEEPEEEEPDDGVPIVLVTGASGFIATHLIKQLLEQGRYRVRGSVRSKKRQEKVI